jgi:hypothetical protein
MSYFPSISQNVTVDTANSIAAQAINAGATWNSAGVGTSTLGVNSIQIIVKADQNCTIYVDQGNANNSFQLTDSYDYITIKQFGLTVQAVSAYVRVRVKNVSITNATNVNVNTVLCPISNPLPRSLDEYGYLKSAIYEINDEYGNKGIISPVGALDVNQPYRLVGASFGSVNDANFWTPTNNGIGSLAVVGSGSGGINGMAIVASGTANNGYGMFTSVRLARFLIGNPNKGRFLLRIPVLTRTGCTRVWGVPTTTGSGATPPSPSDGFFFSLSDTDVLSVNCFNSGSASIASVNSGSFNGNVSSYTMDTNVHVYNIVYYIGKIQFYIDDILIHTMISTTTIPASTFTLPVSCYSKNSASGTTTGTIELWSGSIHRLGRNESSPNLKYQNGAATAVVAKTGAGRLHRIIYGQHPNGGTITVYDALTATNTIMIISLPNGATPTTYECGIDFYVGLTYTTSTANMNVTFVFE